ncbi:MAG: hypothetical protein RL172_34 [Bacteroidota bacterium]|jgi:7,8-dihydroneopterin aldolase/epimerase/oxygenase
MARLTIHLNQLRFFAFHGLYKDEQRNGNTFEVDVDIEAELPEQIEKLKDTIDYVVMYAIIEKRMQTPSHLLETVAQDLAVLMQAADNRIKKVSIQIRKLTPPINNFKGHHVGISFTKEF